jgi:hypothetical protein
MSTTKGMSCYKCGKVKGSDISVVWVNDDDFMLFTNVDGMFPRTCVCCGRIICTKCIKPDKYHSLLTGSECYACGERTHICPKCIDTSFHFYIKSLTFEVAIARCVPIDSDKSFRFCPNHDFELIFAYISRYMPPNEHHRIYYEYELWQRRRLVYFTLGLGCSYPVVMTLGWAFYYNRS